MMAQIRKPDLNAPRFRPSRYNLMDKDFFDRFKEKFPQHKDLSNAELRSIVESYNGLIWESAIENRDGAELPESLGYIFIGSCPSPKGENIDFPLSQETGIPSRHRNFESDNYLAKIFYTNYANKYKFRHRELWQFKGERDFTRKVSEVYPENWKMYVQVDNFSYISKMFRNKRKSNWIKEHVKPAPEDYNEFDMN